MIIPMGRWVDYLELISEKYDMDINYSYDEHFASLRLVLSNIRKREDVPKPETVPKETVNSSDENKATVG